ncbi:GNAT family N-acetyltransferase [Pseudidiomarina sp.]|uniref:GNAT family N-acetyltransferase n=1 Tax=Pseudidiomarina sp. TaxID=2081707 RepID=UPI00299E35F4|nr:GNAT family N-acetyltransferase [Pseudidiomarina sp.]MDX1705946.1 GNAT family N-acetyltransferase [Pseudidiomarina sp.]
MQELLAKLKTAQFRAVFLFDGPGEWLTTQQQLISDQFPRLLHLSGQHDDHTNLNRYRDYLGTSQSAVLLDCSGQLHADAIAALAGTIVGGGVLFIMLPWRDSPFRQRLLRTSTAFGFIKTVTPGFSLEQAVAKLLQNEFQPAPVSGLPNADQTAVINSMVKLPGTCHLLLADRGRGKSTALGLACQAFAQAYKGRKLIVTGPRPAAVATLLEHAGESVQFVAWDRLLSHYDPSTVRLIIDEAAALPMHVLKQLTSTFSVWAVATTVDGYEGCGRGFAVRFVEWLSEHKTCKAQQLIKPVRWSSEDTCEAWLNQALLMKSSTIQKPSPEPDKPVFEGCHASELAEQQLAEVMSLLLEAHYQSSPNDLRLLLDGSDQRLLLCQQQGQLLGVIWYVIEGPVDTSLHNEILQGQRRLPGQILPQALSFYLQQPAALGWRWWRITRIAVAADIRRAGVGSLLLSQLMQAAVKAGVDALGSSFGASTDVVKFWLSNDYQLVRMGRRLNMASGFPNALMGKGLSAEAKLHIQQWQRYCQMEVAWQQQRLDVLPRSLWGIAEAVLRGFAYGNLPFTEAQFAWFVCNRMHSAQQLGVSLPAQILDKAATSAELAQQFGYSDQLSMQQQLRQMARHYLEQLYR